MHGRSVCLFLYFFRPYLRSHPGSCMAVSAPWSRRPARWRKTTQRLGGQYDHRPGSVRQDWIPRSWRRPTERAKQSRRGTVSRQEPAATRRARPAAGPSRLEPATREAHPAPSPGFRAIGVAGTLNSALRMAQPVLALPRTERLRASVTSTEVSAATSGTAKRGHSFDVSILLSPSARERLPALRLTRWHFAAVPSSSGGKEAVCPGGRSRLMCRGQRAGGPRSAALRGGV